MCILFFKTIVNPSPDEYALILVNNRDEEFVRPTLISNFWEEADYIVGGRDATPGKEGGTWLGMSTHGKIGVLLNILQPVGEENSQAKGRGGLVANYLKGNLSSHDYLTSIYQERNAYNNFNLVTIDLKKPFEDFVIGHYSNLTDEPPISLSPGVHGIGNCCQQTPWRKISYGKDIFTNICQQYPKTNTKSELVSQLINFLSDDTPHFPDPQLEGQGKGKNMATLQALSSLCVKVPNTSYGTRTNTVILVDGEGNVEYTERTMKDPIDRNNPIFITNRHTFQI